MEHMRREIADAAAAAAGDETDVVPMFFHPDWRRVSTMDLGGALPSTLDPPTEAVKVRITFWYCMQFLRTYLCKKSD